MTLARQSSSQFFVRLPIAIYRDNNDDDHELKQQKAAFVGMRYIESNYFSPENVHTEYY